MKQDRITLQGRPPWSARTADSGRSTTVYVSPAFMSALAGTRVGFPSMLSTA